jgi:large subunit ribosomal protein L22
MTQPRRTRRKADEAKQADAKQAEADAVEEPAAEAEKAEKEAKPRRRRGSAETTTEKKVAAAPKAADGTVQVRAQARYVRTAPRKARLVVDHIRGRSVADARAILLHTTRGAASDVLGLLDSCVANAENNHELVADELIVSRAYVDQGPTLKRWRPRARGRATRINKRTSHMTIVLSPRTSERAGARKGK